MSPDIDAGFDERSFEPPCGNRPDEAESDYQYIVKWIPLVLPVLALCNVVIVYFIDWAVLSYTM